MPASTRAYALLSESVTRYKSQSFLERQAHALQASSIIIYIVLMRRLEPPLSRPSVRVEPHRHRWYRWLTIQ